jgi:hypothetical protein
MLSQCGVDEIFESLLSAEDIDTKNPDQSGSV